MATPRTLIRMISLRKFFVFIKKKRVILALLILTFSSCHPPQPHWNLEKIRSSIKGTHFNRCYFSSCDPFSNLEFEIIGNRSKFRIFLNVFSLPILPDNPCEDTVSVKVSTENEQNFIQAYLYKGGQRLLIPSPYAEWIIENLQQKKDLTIEVGRYRALIISANFSQQYTKFRAVP